MVGQILSERTIRPQRLCLAAQIVEAHIEKTRNHEVAGDTWPSVSSVRKKSSHCYSSRPPWTGGPTRNPYLQYQTNQYRIPGNNAIKTKQHRARRSMPFICHWRANVDNLLKVQYFKGNRSSNLAFARTPSSSARSQRGAEGRGEDPLP